MATDKTKLIFNPLTGAFDAVQDVTDLVTTSDLATANYIKADGTVPMTGDFNLGANDIVNSASLETNAIKVGVGASNSKIPYANGAYQSMKATRPVFELQTSNTLSTLAFNGADSAIGPVYTGIHINYDNSERSLTFNTQEGVIPYAFKILNNGETSFNNNFTNNIPTPVNNDHISNKSYVDTSVGAYIPLSQKGVANGVATLNGAGNLDLTTKDIQLDSRQFLALRNTAGLKTITKAALAISIGAGASAVIGSVPGFTGDNYGTEFTVTVAGNNNTGSEISKWLLVTNFNNSNPLLANLGSLASGDSTMNYTLSAVTNGSNVDIVLNNSAGPEIVYPRIVFKYQTTI